MMLSLETKQLQDINQLYSVSDKPEYKIINKNLSVIPDLPLKECLASRMPPPK